MTKAAVVLFNLGGPDGREAVEPFLRNLFSDPAIISLPNPLRWVVARLIARQRGPVAREIYGRIGGGSPLLANTLAQARALEESLGDLGIVRCFVAMRYWNPSAEQAVSAVKAFGPDQVVLLPLYPQFSSTTTASSCRAWQEAAKRAGLEVPSRLICCYPTEAGFIDAIVAAVREARARAAQAGRPRILFSAHGLPKKIVARGDPYPWQVEQTCRAIAAALGGVDLDWRVCYQSRVGPVAWIGPGTDEEIRRAGQDGVPVVLAPVAFVSEHSETLVELDIEYRALAERVGVPVYVRVPTVSTRSEFIGGLGRLVRAALGAEAGVTSGVGSRLCPGTAGCCLMTAE